jgi:hypothetical protein
VSDREQDAAIGFLTKRYSEARKARASLVSTIQTMRHSIDRFSRTLATVEGFNPSSNSIPRMPPDYPADRQIALSLEELRSACAELELTQRLLKDAGIEIP